MPDRHATVIRGDARALPLADASVDAIVCDPPYELTSGNGRGFMGKAWDGTGVAFDVATWREAYRVMKPGAHLLAFGGSRTWHRLACAIEDAGFELRDSIGSACAVPVMAWVQGQGFPKSLDVSKAIDKIRDWTLVERLASEIRRARTDVGMSLAEIGRAMQDATGGQYGAWYHRGGHMFFETGRSLPSRPEWEYLRHVLPIAAEFVDVYEQAEREVVRQTKTRRDGGSWAEQVNSGMFRAGERTVTTTAPATDDARRWQGWGTALRPAWEPIVVARKPLAGRVAANVLAYGTGAINVDACRVATTDNLNGGAYSGGGRPSSLDGDDRSAAGAGMFAVGAGRMQGQYVPPSGRWPTNVVLSHQPLLDGDGEVVGDACADGCVEGCPVAELDAQSGNLPGRGNKKPTIARKEAGIYGAYAGVMVDHGSDAGGGASRFFPTFRYQAKAPSKERPKVDGKAHPTVKPLGLMRWLVRLVTPPGGLLLDQFAGSGTTVEAALLEGFNVVGVEYEATYLPLVQARIDRARRSAASAESSSPADGQLVGQTDLLAGLADTA